MQSGKKLGTACFGCCPGSSSTQERGLAFKKDSECRPQVPGFDSQPLVFRYFCRPPALFPQVSVDMELRGEWAGFDLLHLAKICLGLQVYGRVKNDCSRGPSCISLPVSEKCPGKGVQDAVVTGSVRFL